MQHPDVYVGRVAHGHYDSWCDNADTGWSWWSNHNYCTGICGYWEDFRYEMLLIKGNSHSILGKNEEHEIVITLLLLEYQC